MQEIQQSIEMREIKRDEKYLKFLSDHDLEHTYEHTYIPTNGNLHLSLFNL